MLATSLSLTDCPNAALEIVINISAIVSFALNLQPQFRIQNLEDYPEDLAYYAFLLPAADWAVADMSDLRIGYAGGWDGIFYAYILRTNSAFELPSISKLPLLSTLVMVAVIVVVNLLVLLVDPEALELSLSP